MITALVIAQAVVCIVAGLIVYRAGFAAGVRVGRRTRQAIEQDPAVKSIAKASTRHPITFAGPERRR